MMNLKHLIRVNDNHLYYLESENPNFHKETYQ